MYEFISGPLMWGAFFVFVGGSCFKLGWFLWLAMQDKAVFPRMGLKYSLLSFWTWILNFFKTNFKKRPVFDFNYRYFSPLPFSYSYFSLFPRCSLVPSLGYYLVGITG